MSEYNTNDATATDDDVLNGKTAYVKGEKIKGKIQSKMGGSFMPTTVPQVVCPAGVYTSSAYSITGDANLKSANIRNGVEIFGVAGTMRGNDTPSGTLPDNVKTISLETNNPDGGTVYGGGGVSEGMIITVSAIPKGKFNCYGWEENGDTVSEDAEYTFEVTKSRNLKALFSDTHKPLPEGYTEVDWIQNLNISSYISVGKSIDSTFYLEVSFPKGKGTNYEHVFESVDGLPALRTSPTFHWWYRATSGASSMVTQRTLSSGSSVDGINRINIGKNSIMINGTVNSFSNASPALVSDIIIPSSNPSDSQIIRIHYVSWVEGANGNGKNELIPCINPQGIAGLYNLASDTFISPTKGRFITIYDGNFYTISLTNENPRYGTISGDGDYEEGASVTVTAEPNEGYKFVAWKENGTVVSNSTTYTFTVNADRNLVAEFAVRPSYVISVSIDPSGSGEVTGAGRFYEGEIATLTATPSDKYKFSQWKDKSSGKQLGTKTSIEIQVDSNMEIVAEFVDRIPADYTTVEYIESGGKAVINTLIKPTSSTRLVMDVEPLVSPTTAVKYLFNSSISSTYYFSALWATSGVGFRLGTSTIVYPSSSTKLRRITLSLDASSKTAIADGSSKTLTNNTMNSSMINIMLLAAGTTAANSTSAKLYSCQIYSGSSIVRDFVPCVNSEGVAGMYDMVEDVFYPSASSTDFTAGPKI